MPTALPSLHALHCFDVAARAETFSAGAHVMHLTPGAISRQIGILETALGVRLFVRGGRKVTLTPAGRDLALTTERTFATLREGLVSLERRKGGPIVLSCEPTLTVQWLIPRLRGLQEQSPDLVVHVASGGGAPDFEQSGAHLAIRRKDFSVPPGVACTPLMDEWLGPVCSPAYAARLRASASVTLLTTRTRPRAVAEWARGTAHHLSTKRELIFSHFAESLQAAVAGLGAAIGPYPLVVDALAGGRLVAPFGFRRGRVGYALLAPRSEPEDPRVAILRRWLTAEATATKPVRRLRDAGLARSRVE